ncbi:MAG: hypothetical protein LBF12_01785 [Christensenellaceae bacterium]|jgi:ribosomal protein L7Ae-like RNA K-turn-binding protein|nr:hypothetical protein [Christensenellaceae bacterium]
MQELDNLQKSKIKSYIGFAIKSKAIVIGTDNITSYTKKKKLALCLIDKTLSENAKKKISRHFVGNKNLIIIDNLGELSSRGSCRALAIIDANLASVILKCLTPTPSKGAI